MPNAEEGEVRGWLKMSYLAEEKARLKRQQTKEAISLAIEGRWREAVAVNKAIIESFPTDVDAYNRLGRALMELGEYAEAREAYRRALELNPHNKIAQRNLSRLELLKERTLKKDSPKVVPEMFLEETGKAGMVRLINLAPPQVLAKIGTGEEVCLKIDGKRLIIEDKGGEYLGEVEPRHSSRLIKLMEGGNQYTAAIAGSDDGVRVLIKEIYQHPSQAGLLSFPLKEIERFRPYIKDTLIRYEEEEEPPEGGEDYTTGLFLAPHREEEETAAN